MTVSTIGSNPTQTPADRSTGAKGSTPVAIGSASAGKPAASGVADTVHISSQAIDLQGLEAHISSLPDVDNSRVTELRTRIANGQYQVEPARLAGKILGFESGL